MLYNRTIQVTPMFPKQPQHKLFNIVMRVGNVSIRWRNLLMNFYDVDISSSFFARINLGFYLHLYNRRTHMIKKLEKLTSIFVHNMYNIYNMYLHSIIWKGVGMVMLGFEMNLCCFLDNKDFSFCINWINYQKTVFIGKRITKYRIKHLTPSISPNIRSTIRFPLYLYNFTLDMESSSHGVVLFFIFEWIFWT